MVTKSRIDKTIKRVRIGYERSSKEARMEIGRVISGDIRLERKLLNKL